MTTKQAFISLDGADSTGQRAEVYVQKGVGKIIDIAKHENGKTARINVRNAELKHPVGGFLNLDDPIYAEVEKAYDDRTEINYRVESQRKKKNPDGPILRETPIQELRPTTELAVKNCISIFAGINGSLSQEAVTDPSEDPAAGGRNRAVDMNKDKAPQETTTSAPAPLARPSRNIVEERPWEDYNSNGFPNLGSYRFGASVGIDSFVMRLLAESGLDVLSADNEGAIISLTKTILEITDRAQVESYAGTMKEADHSAGSHAKVRGVVFSTIEDFLPMEANFNESGIDEDALQDWKRKVKNVTVRRLSRSLRLGYPDSFGPGTDIYKVSEEAQSEENPVTATKETISELQALVKDSEIQNLNSISALLFKTFNTSKASEVADNLLAEFIKFYGEHGVENFNAVAERAYADVQSN